MGGGAREGTTMRVEIPDESLGVEDHERLSRRLCRAPRDFASLARPYEVAVRLVITRPAELALGEPNDRIAPLQPATVNLKPRARSVSPSCPGRG